MTSPANIQIIITEGLSCKFFLISLMQEYFDYVPEGNTKNPICFSGPKSNNYLIFPHPATGKTHTGGKRLLNSPDTYTSAETTCTGHDWIFNTYDKSYEYNIFRDSDNLDVSGRKRKENNIKSALKTACGEGICCDVFFSEYEVESWFLAGIDTSCSYVEDECRVRKARKSRDSLLKIRDPKEYLDSCLDKGISGARQFIGQVVGKNYKLDVAKNQSESFNFFIERWSEKGLL